MLAIAMILGWIAFLSCIILTLCLAQRAVQRREHKNIPPISTYEDRALPWESPLWDAPPAGEPQGVRPYAH